MASVRFVLQVPPPPPHLTSSPSGTNNFESPPIKNLEKKHCKFMFHFLGQCSQAQILASHPFSDFPMFAGMHMSLYFFIRIGITL